MLTVLTTVCVIYPGLLLPRRYDLLTSFSMQVSPDKKSDKVIQARFFQSLSELQYLGFVASTKRKTDHVIRLTSGHSA